ncbi:MAG: S-methyl-5'-thioadenosine phosphorylase [Chloroflexi bacterium]|nr:S-methyl-5'-thioadenosine phosphorylase [Chloroflexota bacterium]
MTREFAFGIIGGSGLYGFNGLQNVETIEVDTPFGKPSSPIVIGEVKGKKLAFLARHGIGHVLSPSEVNYRANIYAFKELGIDKIISVSAVGSLREDYAPGHIIVPDQIFDFTKDRKRSFFGEGIVAHISTAEPFCPSLSALLLKALQEQEATIHAGGTYITIEGPRFSTRGESNTFRSWGMSLVGMTASPEAFLAREAEICYATMAHVTDYDCWHISEEPVTVEMVINTLSHNLSIAQNTLVRMVDLLAEEDYAACEFGNALNNATMTNPAKIDPETKSRLHLLVDKYLG